jgi:glutamate dehydrogenase (NAD(P)+)
VVIQGFGNAGSIAAQLFREAGARIIAVSDSTGGVLSESGLDPDSLIAHKHRTNSVVGFPGTKAVTNQDLLALPCDILIPAAMENQIRGDNAGRVRARIIVEAANGPTTPAADKLLFARGIPALPDILANSGGVTVSYFEWVQNIENEQWDEAEVNRKLQAKMERATDAVMDKQREINGNLEQLELERQKSGRSSDEKLEPIDLRTAAFVLAISRVATVALERGIWP